MRPILFLVASQAMLLTSSSAAPLQKRAGLDIDLNASPEAEVDHSRPAEHAPLNPANTIRNLNLSAPPPSVIPYPEPNTGSHTDLNLARQAMPLSPTKKVEVPVVPPELAGQDLRVAHIKLYNSKERVEAYGARYPHLGIAKISGK